MYPDRSWLCVEAAGRGLLLRHSAEGEEHRLNEDSAQGDIPYGRLWRVCRYVRHLPFSDLLHVGAVVLEGGFGELEPRRLQRIQCLGQGRMSGAVLGIDPPAPSRHELMDPFVRMPWCDRSADGLRRHAKQVMDRFGRGVHALQDPSSLRDRQACGVQERTDEPEPFYVAVVVGGLSS